MTRRAWMRLARAVTWGVPAGFSIAVILDIPVRRALHRTRARYGNNGAPVLVVDRDQHRDLPPLPPAMRQQVRYAQLFTDSIYGHDPRLRGWTVDGDM